MAKEPDKPARRNVLTGTAQPVTDSVERARGYFKDRPEPSRPPSTRKNWRREPKREEGERESVESPASEPDSDDAEEDRS